MNNAKHRHKHSHLNEFLDIKEALQIKNVQRPRNINNDAIKILTNKLPSDFFRPFTRDHQTIDVLRVPALECDDGMRTPCFGEERRESHSMSLIPKVALMSCKTSCLSGNP